MKDEIKLLPFITLHLSLFLICSLVPISSSFEYGNISIQEIYKIYIHLYKEMYTNLVMLQINHIIIIWPKNHCYSHKYLTFEVRNCTTTNRKHRWFFEIIENNLFYSTRIFKRAFTYVQHSLIPEASIKVIYTYSVRT